MSQQHDHASTRVFLRSYMRQIADTLQQLPWEQLDQLVETLHQARLMRAQVFICGNGGSAATASHFMNDLNKGAIAPGVPRFRAISLVDNVPLLMAWSNDASYDVGLVEPLRNLARPGDLLLGISCSGNSANVLETLPFAREMGMLTIGLTGGPGGRLAQAVDLPVVVPNDCTEQVEDVHMFLEHAIVSALRERAQRELIPSLILADGRGATPASRSAAWSRVWTWPPSDVNTKRGAILLDRDGVIIAHRDDYVKSWDEVEFLPEALPALALLARTGAPIVVVTNQSAINRNRVSFEVVESINLRLMQVVAAHGGRIDAVAWCPHRPDEECGCRKPRPGLLRYAAESLNLDLGRSYLVGDAASDIGAGASVGMATALVLTGRGARQRSEVEATWPTGCRIVPDLMAAARWIMQDLEARAASGSCND
jgi:histidinol-phosphate phosphatase family protein